jgi:hypothetical protein
LPLGFLRTAMQQTASLGRWAMIARMRAGRQMELDVFQRRESDFRVPPVAPAVPRCRTGTTYFRSPTEQHGIAVAPDGHSVPSTIFKPFSPTGSGHCLRRRGWSRKTNLSGLVRCALEPRRTMVLHRITRGGSHSETYSTFVIPLRAGESFPRLSAAGIKTERDLTGLGGVKVVNDLVEHAQERSVDGRRMLASTNLVETNIHYPRHSSLIRNGVRALTCLMRKVTKFAGRTGPSLRDRVRSVQHRLTEIGQANRSKRKTGTES